MGVLFAIISFFCAYYVWIRQSQIEVDRQNQFVYVDPSGSFDLLLQRAKPPSPWSGEPKDTAICTWGEPGKSRATLCKGCDILKNNKAVGLWTPEYLASQANDALLSVKWLPLGDQQEEEEAEFVFQRSLDSLPFSADLEQGVEELQAVKEFRAAGATRMPLSTKDFFARLRSPDDRQYYWSGDLEVFASTAVRDLWPVNESIWLSDNDRNNPVWIGHENVTVRRHFDYTHNVYVQLYGNKTFCLLSHDAAELTTYPYFHPGYRQETIGHNHPNKGDCVTLNAGDALYIPPFTWHHVRANSVSISVSFFSNELILVSEALWALPVPFESSWSNQTLNAALAFYLDQYWPGLRDKMIRTRYTPAFGALECNDNVRTAVCPASDDDHVLFQKLEQFARGHGRVEDVFRSNQVFGAIQQTLLATYFDSLILYFVGAENAHRWLLCCRSSL